MPSTKASFVIIQWLWYSAELHPDAEERVLIRRSVELRLFFLPPRPLVNIFFVFYLFTYT